MIEGWFETWRVLAPLLNETVRFIQNDAVSYILKKKKKRKSRTVSFWTTLFIFLLPPRSRSGEEGKRVALIWIFCRPLSRLEPTDRTQWPTTHRAPARKPRRGGRALAVAPNGRPARCSPCSTAKSHSLGSINNSQHSSNEGGEENRGEGKQTRKTEESGGERKNRKREKGERKRENRKKGKRGGRKPKKKKKGEKTKGKGNGGQGKRKNLPLGY